MRATASLWSSHRDALMRGTEVDSSAWSKLSGRSTLAAAMPTALDDGKPSVGRECISRETRRSTISRIKTSFYFSFPWKMRLMSLVVASWRVSFNPSSRSKCLLCCRAVRRAQLPCVSQIAVSSQSSRASLYLSYVLLCMRRAMHRGLGLYQGLCLGVVWMSV